MCAFACIAPSHSHDAQVINVWRTSTNATKIREAYRELYGADRATKCAEVLPQRPLRGRWMAKQRTEAYLLRCGQTELPEVFHRALGGSMHAAPAAPALPPAVQESSKVREDLGVLDRDEETDRTTLGRWTREAMSALWSNSFWIRLIIGHTSAAPCGHLQAWIHPSTGEGDSQRPKVVELVCSKVSAFFTEWESLLQPDAINTHWGPLTRCLSELSQAKQAAWLGSAVLQVAEMATDFCRRFLFAMQGLPLAAHVAQLQSAWTEMHPAQRMRNRSTAQD